MNNRNPVAAEIRARAHAKVVRCIADASRIYARPFAIPGIAFSTRGTTAGTASLSAWSISLNPILLVENVEAMLEDTVPHEVAHLIHYALAPQDYARGARRAHGPLWQSVMRNLGAVPERCHKMDTTRARVRIVARHEYKCATCGRTAILGPKNHKRVQLGSRYGEGLVWRFGKCGHPFGAKDHVGIDARTERLLAARRAAQEAARN